MPYYVYKITNSINGKIYVGCTMVTIAARWREHLSNGCKPPRPSAEWTCRALYGAMREHGIENFSVECLEVCPDYETMLMRERHWISALSSKAPNGYNLAVRKLTDEQAAIIRFNAYKITQREYAAHFGISLSTVQIVRTGRGSFFTSDPYYYLTWDYLPEEYREPAR